MRHPSKLPPIEQLHLGANEYSFRRAFYPDSACVTCGAPLDISEQLLNIENPDTRCTHDSSHLSVKCGETYCGETYSGLAEMRKFCWWHRNIRCSVPGCKQRLKIEEITPHYQSYHPEIKYRCSQCGLQFSSQNQLDQHGEQTMHTAYVCHYPDCGSESSRIGDLHRHQLTHQKDVLRYPCRHCRK
jgi:DNA-directed RNA polymerase subunit RPC12/RpoP